MFLIKTSEQELTRAQMERARKALLGLLAGRGYPAQFILNNSDEILAIAAAEFVRAVKKGVVVEDPVGFTVHCAYRRAQNFVKAEGIRPQQVSTDTVAELADESAPTPEQMAEESERVRKIRQAIAKLSAEERQLIALTYFEGMSVREAARQLDWTESKGQRRHESALANLRRRLPVKSSDELEIAIGLAAWLSLSGSAAGLHLPPGFEAVVEKAESGATGLWNRLHQLSARASMGGGTEAAGVAGSSGAGRALGACATVLVACVAGAGAVIVPTIGPGGGNSSPAHHHSPPSASAQRTTTAPASARTSPSTAAASAPTPSQHRSKTKAEATESRRARARAAKAKRQGAEVDQVESQTSGIARAAEESTPTGHEAAVASSESASSETVTVNPSGGGASSAETTQAKEQFSPFQ